MADAQSTHPVALITGGSRGIGRGIALALAQRANCDCVINYVRNADAAEHVKRLIEAMGRRARIVQADISVAEDRRRLVDETLLAFDRIDLLVNNAGVAPLARADILDATEESFDRLINVNLKGPYFLTQLVARKMIEREEEGSGARGEGTEGQSSADPCPLTPVPSRKIVTISSVSAYTASISRGDYCVAKAGLAMMTRLFATRLAKHGINVFEIRPGVIETEMTAPVRDTYQRMIREQDLTPIARWGQVDDVARAVVAIALDLLPFSTGEVINVDGGFHLRRL